MTTITTSPGAPPTGLPWNHLPPALGRAIVRYNQPEHYRRPHTPPPPLPKRHPGATLADALAYTGPTVTKASPTWFTPRPHRPAMMRG